MSVRAGTAYVDVRGDFSKLTRQANGLGRDKRWSKIGHGIGSGIAGGAAASLKGGAVLGAAVAFEAKRAVEAFQESNKVARQTQATLKSTGRVAGITAKDISNLATAISRKTGVDDEAIASGENLLLTFTNVRNEAGKGNQIFSRATQTITDMSVALGQDTKASAIQLGKALNDPIKGVTALSRVGVSFTQQQKDQIKTLVDSGKTVDAQKLILRELGKEFGGSAEAQATGTAKMKVAFGNLEEDIGSGIAPAVDQLTDKLTSLAIDVEPKVIKAADNIAKVFGRKDLSLDQKFRLSFDVAQEDLEPLVRKVGDKLEQAHLGDRLADGVTAVAPKIADALAAHAPKAAGAFVHAFMGADVWGRLLVGGFLLKKMGGLGAFTGLGATAGTAMGTGMAAAAGTGFKGRLASVLGGGGLLAKRLVALDVGLNLVDARGNPIVGAINSAHDLTFGIVPKVKYPSVDERTKKHLQDVTGEISKLSQAQDFRGLSRLSTRIQALADDARAFKNEKLGKEWDKLAAAAIKPVEAADGVADALASLRSSGAGSIKSLRGSVRANMDLIRRSLDADSTKGKEALVANFRAARVSIRKSMEAGYISTKDGLAEIKKLMRQELAVYGITGKQATRYMANQDTVRGTPLSGGNEGSSTPFKRKRRGGPIVGGKPSGDTVPAMLERGEYVLNREAVKHLGQDALDRINYSAAPRFQKGGIVALGRQLQREGYAVGENPAFGGVRGKHATNSYHYRGQALDVNADNFPGGEAGALDRLYARLKGMPGVVELLWRVKDHFDHLHVAMGGGGALPGLEVPQLARTVFSGPNSPLKGVMQGALDATTRAAQKRLGDIAQSFGGDLGESAFNGSAGGQYDKGALKALWVQAGGDPKVANLMAAIALAESGGDPNIANPSGATGLWQILGNPFPGNPRDPLTNARMAVSKYKSQGLGAWEAYTKGTHRQFLRAGGLVGSGSGTTARAGVPRRSIANQIRHGSLRDVRGLLKKVKALGLPDGLQKRLTGLSRDADVFGEYADRAGQLTIDPDDPNGDPILGRVGGKTQAEWLIEQLTALFQWRNALIDAEAIAAARREQVSKLVVAARTRLTVVSTEIRAGAQTRRGLVRQLEVAQKHPKRNATLIKGLKAKIKAVDDRQTPRTQLRDQLQDKVLPALTGKRDGLRDLRGDLLSSLTDVQGVGSPMTRLNALPALGILGGRIFDTQMTLGQLTATRPKITDDTSSTDSTDGVDSERATILEQLLREANLRTAVSQAQYKQLEGFPPFGGSFKTGGVVPGPTGAPRIIEAHAGETVIPVGGTAAGTPNVVLNFAPGTEWLRDFVRVEVQDTTRRQARAGARILPGHGGGTR